MRKYVLVAAILLIVSLFAGAEGELNVYFLNVGHGDAILIDYRDWECLIDTGY